MSKKVFVNLNYVVKNIIGTKIFLQKRNKKYKFGTYNYGEVCRNWHNLSDNDPWDIFAPGYKKTLPIGQYYCIDVIGVLFLENGNHKIGIKIDYPGYSDNLSNQEIKHYTKQYCKSMNLYGIWISC